MHMKDSLAGGRPIVHADVVTRRRVAFFDDLTNTVHTVKRVYLLLLARVQPRRHMPPRNQQCVPCSYGVHVPERDDEIVFVYQPVLFDAAQRTFFTFIHHSSPSWLRAG